MTTTKQLIEKLGRVKVRAPVCEQNSVTFELVTPLTPLQVRYVITHNDRRWTYDNLEQAALRYIEETK